MLNENVSVSKSDQLTLSALPSVLRNLSQLGRSGILRTSFLNGFAYFELEAGNITRFLVPEEVFVDYLVAKLTQANLLKVNIAELLVQSQMDLREFSLFLVEEKMSTNTQVSAMFLKFSREIMFTLFEQAEGTLDFNIRTDLIDHIEPTAYELTISATPGQIFLDYREMREKVLELEDMGMYYFSSKTELGTIFSPIEKSIVDRAQSGADIQGLIDGVFEARDEVVETMLRLTQSGILIVDQVPGIEGDVLSQAVGLQSSEMEREKSSTLPVEDKKGVFPENCLPYIVLAMLAKFVIEYSSLISIVENTFPN